MANKVNKTVTKSKNVNETKTKANKGNEENQISTQEKKHFKTPTDTWWGKAIVWVIMFGLVGLIILSFVLAVLSGNA